MRINKFLAQAGIASRRKVDELIGEGRVTVNGKSASLGQEIKSDDNVLVDGREVQKLQDPVYIILNKPKGVTSTVYDSHARRTVIDIVKYSSSEAKRSSEETSSWSEAIGSKKGFYQSFHSFQNDNKSSPRLFPVGRLDQESTGLILLTNDGELANRLTHPKFHIPKIYEVAILGAISQNQINKIESGIFLEEGKTAPAKVEITYETPHKTVLNITLFEGKKRQIRRITASLHLHILGLKRLSIGPIVLGNLPSGKFRKLTEKEVKALKNAANLIN